MSKYRQCPGHNLAHWSIAHTYGKDWQEIWARENNCCFRVCVWGLWINFFIFLILWHICHKEQPMEKYNHFYNILQITSISSLDNLQSKQVNWLNQCSNTPLRDLKDRTYASTFPAAHGLLRLCYHSWFTQFPPNRCRIRLIFMLQRYT